MYKVEDEIGLKSNVKVTSFNEDGTIKKTFHGFVSKVFEKGTYMYEEDFVIGLGHYYYSHELLLITITHIDGKYSLNSRYILLENRPFNENVDLVKIEKVKEETYI